MKLHRYLATWFACDQGGSSYPKYKEGQSYPVTDETTLHVSQGVAVEIEVDTTPERAASLAEKARAAAERAAAAAVAAQQLAEAAIVAQQVAEAQASREATEAKRLEDERAGQLSIEGTDQAPAGDTPALAPSGAETDPAST